MTRTAIARFPPSVTFGNWSRHNQIAKDLDLFVKGLIQTTVSGRDLASFTQSVSTEPAVTKYFELRPENKAEPYLARDSFLLAEASIDYFYLLDSKRKIRPYWIGPGWSPEDTRAWLWALGGIAGQNLPVEWIRSTLPKQTVPKFEQCFQSGLIVETKDPDIYLDNFERPGIYRLQHASALIKTETTGVIIDPHFHSVYEPKTLERNFCPRQIVENVNAILISHFHDDHFQIPSLAMFPRDTLIIVPDVPTPNILCGDFKSLLKDWGFQNVMSPKWYDPPILVGDIEVTALPFFGEQPTADQPPRHPGIHNYGSTYRVQTPELKIWFLVDSGNDFRGRMSDVAIHLREKKLDVDLVVSCIGEFRFRNSFAINMGLNLLTLSPEQMSRFSTHGDQKLTLDAEGLAEICQILGAKFFLPYGHLWGEIGSNSVEKNRLPQLTDYLQKMATSTEIREWKIGERFAFDTV